MEELSWKKSSHSSANGGNCVEIAALQGGVVIRDSKDPSIGHLMVSAPEFNAFITALRGI